MALKTEEFVNVGPFRALLPLSFGFMPLLLGFLTAIGPISTDIYLPALPALEADLSTNMSGGALTMMVWVAGLAVGQIVAGPFVDSWGRKLPLMCGALIYAFFSFLSAEATGLIDFCIFRFCAAAAGAVSLVSPKACVRDLTSGNQSASLMSKLVLVQGIVPILAPALGGLALSYISWRTLFLWMSVYGLAAFFLEWIFLPETLTKANCKPVSFRSMLPTMKAIWKDPVFKWCGLIWMAQGMTVFSYLAGAPDLFERVFALNPVQYGSLFGIISVGLIGTSSFNIVLLRFFPARTILKGSVIGSCIAGAFCFVVVLLILSEVEFIKSIHDFNLYMAAFACFIALLPGALIGPNAFACALENQSRHAGMASAMGGCGVYIFGTIGTAVVASSPANPTVGMATIFLFASLFMLFCFYKAKAILRDLRIGE